MFIGGENARLFQEGKNTLAVTSHVPMTPLERCVASGDEGGTTACQVALQQVPAPEGLSNQELEKFVEVGTAEALEKLHQALSVHNETLTFALQHKTGRRGQKVPFSFRDACHRCRVGSGAWLFNRSAKAV